MNRRFQMSSKAENTAWLQSLLNPPTRDWLEQFQHHVSVVPQVHNSRKTFTRNSYTKSGSQDLVISSQSNAFLTVPVSPDR